MPHIIKVFWRAVQKFMDDGGTAIASNVALSLLLSLFPFLMLVASLLRIWGDTALLYSLDFILYLTVRIISVFIDNIRRVIRERS